MSTLTLWSTPFRSPLSEFDALVRRAFLAPAPQERTFTPATEIVRDGDDAVLRLELPGLDVSKDVEIEVADGRLVVRGERRDESTSEDGVVRFREVRYGSFRRSFTLPSTVSADAVSASYDAGILTVRVAGAYAASQVRRIEIAGAPAVAPVEAPAVADAAAPAEGSQQAA